MEFTKLDDLLEDYKNAVLKAYGYGKTNFLKMTDAQQAAKQAIFELFEKEIEDEN